MFLKKFNRSEAVCTCFFLTLVLWRLPCIVSDDGDDEKRPYEFGFSIEGQQHRHEAKDKEGLVNGEFGFITGDGIYHVTVYATDKDGKFIIRSMESFKVSGPLDGSPDLSGIPIEYSITDIQNRIKTKLTTPAPPTTPPKPLILPLSTEKPVIKLESTPVVPTTGRPIRFTNPPKPVEFTTIRPLNVASCGGCSIPSTTKVPFGKPNKFQFQTPEFQNPGVDLPLELGEKPSYETGSVDSYQEPLNRPSYELVNTEVLQPPLGGPNSENSPLPENPPGVNGVSPLGGSNNQGDSENSPGINGVPPFGEPNNQGTAGIPENSPEGSPLPENSPETNGGFLASVPINEVDSPINPSYENSPQNPFNPEIPPAGNYDSIGGQPGPGSAYIDTGKVQPGKVQPKPINSLVQASRPTRKPSHEISFFPGLIHSPEDPEQEQIPITGSLPPGVTVGDMTELLYRFNYSVGFHGHYETGYRSGVRIGGYYINYRDGYSRIVEYVADENGYRPKTSLVFLGLDSPDTPKEETEKEFGLKGQVFEWFSL